MANKTDCAWCLQETDELKNQSSNDSHGVCEDHSNAILYAYYENKYNAVPSYLERFKHDHEAEDASAA